jgi:hypothetical protein
MPAANWNLDPTAAAAAGAYAKQNCRFILIEKKVCAYTSNVGTD